VFFFFFSSFFLSRTGVKEGQVRGNLGTMVIELMLISGFGFSAIVGVALTGAVDEGAEKLKM
jgi:hypothetical protein